MDEVRRKRIRHYLAYAAGEVVLIFIGISLALAFQNMNERRRVAALERDLLAVIARNLVANVEELDRNISQDEGALAALEPLLEHFSHKAPWQDSLAVQLGRGMSWSSPYFVSSGYESLKQLGLQVVSNESVRDYEGTYARLQNERDRIQWAFFEATLLPVRNRELDVVDAGTGPRAFRVRDYASAMERGELLSALSEHRRYMRQGLIERYAAREETVRAIEAIEAYLAV
jgi:hypothetical protein